MENNSKLLKKMVKESIEDAAIFTTAIFATGPIGGIAIGYLTVTNKKHLSSGFNAALKKWRQKSGQSLTLKAKMLRFRNTVSYGLASVLENRREASYKRSMMNPYYKESFLKASQEGRKMKLSEKLKAKLKFFGATMREQALSPDSIDNIQNLLKQPVKKTQSEITPQDVSKLSTQELMQKIMRKKQNSR